MARSRAYTTATFGGERLAGRGHDEQRQHNLAVALLDQLHRAFPSLEQIELLELSRLLLPFGPTKCLKRAEPTDCLRRLAATFCSAWLQARGVKPKVTSATILRARRAPAGARTKASKKVEERRSKLIAAIRKFERARRTR